MDSNFLKNIGETYLQFEVTKIVQIRELNCILRELVHKPSGAQIMHIENNDPENLFCLSFKTYPSSSNGAAHILEHVVLCGSKKFPVKDPFFSMTRRSLNTFMNAMTGADFTCYPAASQVEKDYFNLFEVYLDAVFHPQLKEVSFLQEGIRLEFSEHNNIQSPLEYKGIVFNEMKGSLSSADSRLWHAMIKLLTPDLPYAHNSGGDPTEIPNLTYEELINFYETYYHPSQCLFFLYGNIPLKTNLDFIYEKTLKHVLSQPSIPPIPKQKRFTEPVRKHFTYPVEEDEEDSSDRTMISFGWLTCPLQQQEDVLALSILDAILMDTDASPLKKALLDSGLCSQADAFVDNEMSEMPYVITCKGCEEKDADALEQHLFTSLKKIAEDPIPQHLIEAVIHQIEFSRLEITGDHSPFGLTLFLRSALAKQHGCEPENALVIYSLFEKLSQKAKDPQFLSDLLRKYLIENTHFVRLTFSPNPQLAKQEADEEEKKLISTKEKLTETETKKIIKQTEELEEYLKSVETQNLSCLPKMTLDDVPVLVRQFDLKKEKHNNFEIFHHECFTNHIIYSDICFDLPHIDEEDLPYMQILLFILPEIGSGDRDYVKNLEYIQAHTGGISVSSALHIQATNSKLLKPCINIRGKCLNRKSEKLFSLYRDMITKPDLSDKKRIEELLKQIHTSLVNRLPRHALRYAIQEALSGFHISTHFNNVSFGLKYFHTIQDICKNLESNISKVIDRLLNLKDKVLSYKNNNLILSCNENDFNNLKEQKFFDLFTGLPTKNLEPWSSNYTLHPVTSKARSVSSPVVYNVKAMPTISFVHPDSAALTVATQLFDNKTLLHKVREKGGAYGVGTNYSAASGCFYFHSYRDPHVVSTIDAFDYAIASTIKGNFNQEDLDEAKLGIIQQLDSPISPGNRAITAYSWLRDDKSTQFRQEYRSRIINLTKENLIHSVKSHLEIMQKQGVTVSFGNKELIEKENKILEQTKRELPIMPI